MSVIRKYFCSHLLFTFIFITCFASSQVMSAEKAVKQNDKAIAKSEQSVYPGTAHFRVNRNLPFYDLGVINVKLYVSDYQKNNKSDAEAILDALNALNKTKGKAELIFDSPSYEIESEGDGSHIYSLSGMTDKIINGNNSLIVIKNPTVGFLRLTKSENCIVKDFNLDYDPLPYVQARIQSVDYKKGNFICLVDEGFSDFDAEHVSQAPQNWTMIKDVNFPGRNKQGTKAHYPNPSSIEKLGYKKYRVSIGSSNIQDFSEEDVFIRIARYNGSPAFALANCNRLSLIGITIYSSPAGGFNIRLSSEMNLLNCQVKMKEGRFLSSNADCIHYMGSSVGPWIEDCLFEGHSDDTFNLKWKNALIKTQTNAKNLTIDNDCEVGELLWLYNPREGVLIDTVRVVKVTREDNQTYHLTVDRNLPSLNTGRTDQRGDIIYFDSQRNESFVFRNNIIRDHRRYGMLMQSGYGLIENNRFENTSNSAITIENGVDWGEGFVCEQLLIRNNVFVNNGYDKTYLTEQRGVIQIQMCKLENPNATGQWAGVAPAPWKGMKNIRIEHNTFENWNVKAIHVVSADNIVISNNNFSPAKTPSHQAIYSSNANVIEENNDFLYTDKFMYEEGECINKIICFDICGRVVFSMNINESIDNVYNIIAPNMQSLKGVHLFRIFTNSGGVKTRKIVVTGS